MNRTVLVVDDIAFVRKTLIKILTANHFKVVGEAEDGHKAVLMYQKLKPDLVTMDIVMPVLSGIDACRRICKMDKGARVVMVTGMDQENLIMEAIGAGARDYVVKPFTEADIVKTLEHVLMGAESVQRRTKGL